MKREEAYIIGIHRYAFRYGIPARIIGIEFVTPEGLDERLAYHTRYSDGAEDWVPVGDSSFRVITFQDIITDNLPDPIEPENDTKWADPSYFPTG